MRAAVIDLGTNTCNLLIADIGEGGHYTLRHKNKLPVRLGEGGIHKGYLTEEAFARGMEMLGFQREIIDEYKAERCVPLATSAIRNASNGRAFMERAKEKYGLKLTSIDGQAEAALIYRGVKLAVEMSREKMLILDIGGGSNEFIIADRDKIYWKGSFETGIARVLEAIRPSDPLSERDIKEIGAFFEAGHREMFVQAQKHGVTTLIGSSGSFDTFTALTHDEPYTYDSVDNASSRDINLERYRQAHLRLIYSSRDERIRMKGMDRMRVQMIPVASLLLSSLLRQLKITRLIQSEFAMKEGVLWELMNGEILLKQITGH